MSKTIEVEEMQKEILQLEIVFNEAKEHKNSYVIKKITDTTHSLEEVLFSIFTPIEKEPSIPQNLKTIDVNSLDKNLSDEEIKKINKQNGIIESTKILAEKTQSSREIILDDNNKLYVSYLDYEARVNINYEKLSEEEKKHYIKKNGKYYTKKHVFLTSIDKDIFDAITIIASNIKYRKSVRGDTIIVTFTDKEINDIVNKKARIKDNKVEIRNEEEKKEKEKNTIPAYFRIQVENCLLKLKSTNITRIYESSYKNKDYEKIQINKQKEYNMISSFEIIENSNITKRKTDIAYEVRFSEEYSKYLMATNTLNLTDLKFQLNEELILEFNGKKIPKIPLTKAIIEYIICDWNSKYKDTKSSQQENYDLKKILYRVNYLRKEYDNVAPYLISELNKNRINFDKFGIEWNSNNQSFRYDGEKKNLSKALPLIDITRFKKDIATKKSAKKSTL